MSANYKNWIPNGMVTGFIAGTAVLAGTTAAAAIFGKKQSKAYKPVTAALAVGTAAMSAATLWLRICQERYSYTGTRQLSRQIVEGTAEYVELAQDGLCLDVGCGSGALTIAVAKRNPQAKIIGIDRWGKEYASFSKELCESNASEEGVTNTEFMQGDAVKLDFPDETFDAVTSNYVYHNIPSRNRQDILRETFRVLKKGGTFAIHDIMSKSKYGDMQKFADELKSEGFESVELIDTTKGKFMSPTEAALMALSGSKLLVPTVLTQDYVKFEQVSDYEVKGILTYKSVTVSGIFKFNEQYEMVSFRTDHRTASGNDGKLEHIPWTALCSDYEVSDNGIKVPTKFQAVWNYEDGDFVYFDGKISSVTHG